MAKRRAAFLLKQQRKAEETRLRKQQLEAESELKRDEARYVGRSPPQKYVGRPEACLGRALLSCSSLKA